MGTLIKEYDFTITMVNDYSYTRKPRNQESRIESLSITSIQKYLKMLKEEVNYTILWRKGPLSNKQSFHKYRDWLLKKEFVTNRTQPRKTVRGVSRGRPFFAPHSFFKITTKGRKFLEMLQ